MELPDSLLIVDDDPELLKLIGHFAKRAGIKKILCVTCSDELDKKADDNYSVALVDLFLLNEQGSDVIRMLQRKSRNMSILAMTGATDRDDKIEEAHKAGAISCLFKPVSYNYFLNMMYLAESIRIKKVTFHKNHNFLRRFLKKMRRRLRHLLGMRH